MHFPKTPIKTGIQKFSLSLLFIAIIIVFSSCKNEIIKTICFDLEKDNHTPEININSIVRLETNDNCLIGEISKISITPQSIYILDRMISNGLFLFNQDGKFITKTHTGRGPDEVSAPWDFIIDEKKQTIQLWESLNYRMMEFDLKLNHIKTDKYPGLILHNMEKIDNDRILVSSQSNPYLVNTDEDAEFSPYNYFIYKNDFSKTVKKLLPLPPDFCSFNADVPICKTDRILFLSSLDFNIYGLNNHEPQIIYKLDFGNLTITETDINKGSNYVLKEIRKGKKIGFLGNLFENKHFLSFSFGRWYKYHFYIHSKETGINYYSENLFLNKVLPRCQIKGILGDGTFIGIVKAQDLKNFLPENNIYNIQLQEISEFDNDFIIYFSIDKKLAN